MSYLLILFLCALLQQNIFVASVAYTANWEKVNPKGDVLSRQQHTGVKAFLPNGAEKRTCLLVFGGVHSWTDEGGYLNDVVCLDVDSEEWINLKPTGNPPTGRRRHSAVASDTSMLIFGGISTNHKAVNDLHKYNFAKNAWVSFTAKGTPPSARSGHTAIVSNANQMILFGGQDSGTVFLNDIHKYDIANDAWLQVRSPSGVLPIGRALASVVLIDSSMYVFAGIKGYGGYKYYLNDMIKYDIDANGWESTPNTGAVPSQRAYHSAVVMENEKQLVFGGYGLTMMDDLYIYDPKQDKASWNRVASVGDLASKRECQTAIPTADNQMIFFGGFDGEWDGILNDVYRVTVTVD